MRTILEINDRVRITSNCNSKGYKGVIIGRYINGRGCNHVMIHLDNGKKQGYNRHNSTLGVQCNSKEKCDWRFSVMCNTCQHNCGMKKDKNSYVAR